MVALPESCETSDIVALSIPRGSAYLPVVRVVIGGMASRHALPVDSLDDIQLAVEALLREEPPSGGEVTIALSADDVLFKVVLSGLVSLLTRDALSCDQGVHEQAFGAENVLRMIMDALVDGYGMAEVAEAGSFAVRMEKRIA